MEGLERIHQQICQEAETEAAAIREAALQSQAAALREAQAQADELYENALAESRAKQQRAESQLRAELNMTERRTLLGTKQMWIHKVFAAALKQLAAREESVKIADYLTMLENPDFLSECRANANVVPVIELAANDVALLPALRAELPFKAEIKADRKDFTAGLTVTVGQVHFNYTYEEDMRRREAEFIGTVGAKLFPGKD